MVSQLLCWVLYLIISFNPHNNTIGYGLLLALFCRWGNCGTLLSSSFLKVKHLVRVTIWTKKVCLQILHVLSPYLDAPANKITTLDSKIYFYTLLFQSCGIMLRRVEHVLYQLCSSHMLAGGLGDNSDYLMIVWQVSVLWWWRQ